LPQVTEAGPTVHRSEHYHGTKDPDIDEVFLTGEGPGDWKFVAKGLVAGAAAFERLTGESEPDFAATGFEDQMMIAMHARRSQRM
jgi:hypothetical protein